MHSLARSAGLCVLVAAPSIASAALSVDGVRDAVYGSARAVQTVQTGFGDSSGFSNGSELDAGYATVESGRLNVILTGNLENNFNKLEIFIDSKIGGQNVYNSAGYDNTDRLNGTKFDAGFTADYHLIVRRGAGKFDVDFMDLNAATASSYQDMFAGVDIGVGATGTGVNSSPIQIGLDDSNTAGVTGGSDAADPVAAAAVTTGLEFSIALSDLGYTSGPIHIMAGQNNSEHNYWSNQFLGGLAAPQNNLGGDGFGSFTGVAVIDFTQLAGDQYFTVPEPASLAAFSALGALLARRRR